MTSRTAKQLSWAGTLPFFFGAYLSFSDQNFIGIQGPSLFINYAVIILAFMGGSLWGRVAESSHNASKRHILLISNVIALVAFVILIIAEWAKLSLLVSALAFLLLWRYEKTAFKPHTVISDYSRLRGQLTVTVVSLHLLILLLS